MLHPASKVATLMSERGHLRLARLSTSGNNGSTGYELRANARRSRQIISGRPCEDRRVVDGTMEGSDCLSNMQDAGMEGSRLRCKFSETCARRLCGWDSGIPDDFGDVSDMHVYAIIQCCDDGSFSRISSGDRPPIGASFPGHIRWIIILRHSRASRFLAPRCVLDTWGA